MEGQKREKKSSAGKSFVATNAFLDLPSSTLHLPGQHFRRRS
jgi:hypothetical protein